MLQLTFTGTFTGSPRTVSYTVPSGGTTTTQMATGLINAINADAVLLAIAGRFVAFSNSPPNNGFGIQFDGTSTLGLAITGAGNVTGAATETLTIGGGGVGQNNFSAGYLAMPALMLTTGSSNVAIGNATLTGLTTGIGNIAIGRSAGLNTSSASSSVAIGDLALVANTTGAGNIAIGANAATALDVGFNNVVIGLNAGLIATGTNFKNNTLIGVSAGRGMTSGGSNIIIGAQNTATSQNQVTTGTNNVAIGISVAVPSQTASGGLSIQNAIYGINNTAVDGNISAGRIGFYTAGQPLRFDWPDRHHRVAYSQSSPTSRPLRLPSAPRPSTTTRPMFVAQSPAAPARPASPSPSRCPICPPSLTSWSAPETGSRSPIRFSRGDYHCARRRHRACIRLHGDPMTEIRLLSVSGSYVATLTMDDTAATGRPGNTATASSSRNRRLRWRTAARCGFTAGRTR